MDNNGKDNKYIEGKEKVGKSVERGVYRDKNEAETLRKESGEQEEEKGRQDKIADSESFS